MNQADPRVRRTRKLLQQALTDLLAQKSFHSINVQDITDRATVNRATFYAHFPDKYAMLDAFLREEFQRAVAEQLPPVLTWNKQHLHAFIRLTFTFLGEIHQHCKPSDTQLDPLMEQAIHQEIAEILLNWLKRARVADARQRIRIETVALVM